MRGGCRAGFFLQLSVQMHDLCSKSLSDLVFKVNTKKQLLPPYLLSLIHLQPHPGSSKAPESSWAAVQIPDPLSP